MHIDNNVHLNESQLMAAVVDITELETEAKTHLTRCTQCAQKVKAFETAFINLGHSARRLAPLPSKRPRLPVEKQGNVFLRPALAAAFTLALVIWGAWLAFDSPAPKDAPSLPEMAMTVWEDEAFMAEVASLSKNALPEEYKPLLQAFDLPDDESVPEDMKNETQSFIPKPERKGTSIC